MNSVSPVLSGSEEFEVVYAANQPEYNPLPVLRTDKALLTRWRLTPDEIQRLQNGEDLYICIMHFGGPLQPLLPIVCNEKEAQALLVEV